MAPEAVWQVWQRHTNPTTLGQLILRKIIKIVATRCQILRLKCTKIDKEGGKGRKERGGEDRKGGEKRDRKRSKGGRKGRGEKEREGEGERIARPILVCFRRRCVSRVSLLFNGNLIDI